MLKHRSRPLRGGEVVLHAGPLELVLFNSANFMENLFAGLFTDDVSELRCRADEMQRQADIVMATAQRIANTDLSRMKCFTCEHEFSHCPDNLGYIKETLGERAMTLALCPECARLSIGEVKRRIFARLGNVYEMQVGTA
jgi:hypothetical protein